MDENKITRINELARKSKAEGLTAEEKREQSLLRQEFLAAVRTNLKSQLDNIDIQEPDGSVVNLGEKYGKKQKSGNQDGSKTAQNQSRPGASS